MLGFVNFVLVVAVVQNADRVEIHEDARIEIVGGERALANMTGRGYGECSPKNPAGCLVCTPGQKGGRSIEGYTLTPVDFPGNTEYMLQLQSGQTIPVVLPAVPVNDRGMGVPKNAAGGNCFIFSTHQVGGGKGGGTPSQVPGQSPDLVAKYGNSPVLKPANIDAEGVEEALRREGAVFLGRTAEDFKSLGELEVQEGVRYYIVAVFILPHDDYHFWGLWNSGWFSTPSLISSNVMDRGSGYETTPVKHCPTEGVFMSLRKEGRTYSDKMGGFYLFPCKKEKC